MEDMETSYRGSPTRRLLLCLTITLLITWTLAASTVSPSSSEAPTGTTVYTTPRYYNCSEHCLPRPTGPDTDNCTTNNSSSSENNQTVSNHTTSLCNNTAGDCETDCVNVTVNCTIDDANNTTPSADQNATNICNVSDSSIEDKGLCDNSNGHCHYGCDDGFAMPDCQTECDANCIQCTLDLERNISSCNLCVKDYFINNNMMCQPCPVNCSNTTSSESVCKMESGRCNFGCNPGRHGAHCDQSCDIRCYPFVCEQDSGCCSGECRHEKLCGCNCRDPCSEKCKDERCYTNCTCKAGCNGNFWGSRCENMCSENCEPLPNDETSCDERSGHCFAGCKENRFWGDRCEHTCSQNCQNGTCVRENGTCLLGCESPTWFRYNCSESCNVNCVNQSCYQSSGECISGCRTGYFGPTCSQRCSPNCRDSSCNRSDETCIHGCKDGYYDFTCGLQCNEHCRDDVCDFEGGNCTNGCDEGWMSYMCDEQTEVVLEEADDNLWLNVGIGAGSVVLLGITLAIVCGNRRRREKIRRGVRSAVRSVVDRTTRIFSGDFSSRKTKGFSEISPYGVKMDVAFSSRINVEDILNVVVKMTVEELNNEFEKLSSGYSREFGIAREAQNITKNFYNVYPYDENRVALQLDPPALGSDYINASYIKGFKPERRYIAAQGPLKPTFGDFWKMVWQQDVSLIVMLLNVGENDSEKYWPGMGTDVTFGGINVRGTSKDVFADFIIREFTLSRNYTERVIKHMQFMRWPETNQGVPPSAVEMMEFFYKYRAVLKTTDSKGPILVHCNSGIGRTGVFIGLDYVTDDVLQTGSLDVHSTVSELRKQRADMVQRRVHYQFLYEVAAQVMAFECDLVPKKRQGILFERLINTEIKGVSQLRRLYKTCNSSLVLDEQEIASIDRQQETRKVRPTSDIPELRYRSMLFNSMFVNAVNIDTYKEADTIVATQMPSPETMDEFIQLVLQRDCGVILMLNIPDKDDESMALYWKTTATYDGVKVTHAKVKKFPTHKTRTLTLEDKKNKDKKGKPVRHEVQFIQYHDWDDRAETEKLPSAQSLVNLVKTVKQAMEQVPGKRLLVHCLNGSDQTGLFCMVYNLLEKADLEEFINVVCTIRKVKTRSPSALPTFNQFKLCYEAFILYLGQKDILTYADINSAYNTGQVDSEDERPSTSGGHTSDYMTENPNYNAYSDKDDSEDDEEPADGGYAIMSEVNSKHEQ